MSASTQILTQSIYGFKSERNSSITPLSGGATFTGEGETFASNEVFVAVKSDQTGILYLDFSDNDGVDYETKSFDIPADSYKEIHEFKAARTLKVRFTNTSGGAQTSLNLSTYYGEYGTGAGAGSSVNGVTVSNLPLSAFGDLRTAEITPIFQGSFEYTVDNTELTTNLVTNGGTVTQADAMAVISSSTTTGSMACLQSRRHARYRAGMGALMRFTTLFTAPVAATEQLAGLVDEEGSSAAFKNGLMVGYIGATFGFHRFANDIVDTIALSDWDDPLDGSGASGMTIDTTKINIWAINYQYLGAGEITISVENPATGLFFPAHKIKYANANIVPSSYNPNYFFMLYVNNKATTSDLILKSASYAYFTEGKVTFFEVHQPQISSGEQTKSSVTSEVPIFTMRNKSTYASKINFIDVQLEVASASIEAGSPNNLGSVRLVRDATLTGASYVDLNTSDSVVELDNSATVLSGGKELLTSPMAGKNDRAIMDLINLKIILAPGEAITLAGSSANSATINGSLLVKELF